MPIAIPLATAAFSIFQGAAAASKRNKLEAETKAKIAALKPNQSILDYYNKAYNAYSPNAYQSATYNNLMRGIQAQQATGINALQNRRMALAGIPSIVQGSNIAAGRAAAQSESAMDRALSRLGGAASMKAAEENRITGLDISTTAQEAAAQAAATRQYQSNAANAFMNAGSIAYKSGSAGNYGFGGGTSTAGSSAMGFDEYGR